jgi:hypothetical protein
LADESLKLYSPVIKELDLPPLAGPEISRRRPAVQIAL